MGKEVNMKLPKRKAATSFEDLAEVSAACAAVKARKHRLKLVLATRDIPT